MTKLCARGKAAAKRKFKVYPSAYANAYASKICAGKAKDPSGLKRKDWGPKKANTGDLMTKDKRNPNREPSTKIFDVIGDIFEKCVAKAVLKAVSDGYSLSKTPIYPIIEGYIGTNGKKYKHNFFKRLKLFFFRKLKIYFLNHKKY